MDSNSSIQQPEERPALISYEDVASRLELAVLRPELHEDQVAEACHRALAARIGAVVVRPSDTDMAVRILGGTPVRVASVSGFPHGTSNTATKLYEGRDLLRRGAKEIGLVVNTAKMISRQFQHVETEVLQMSESCHQLDAILKVIFEPAWFAEDLKIIVCKMCKRTEADFIEAGIGIGTGSYSETDLRLLKSICKDIVRIKATDGPATLEGFTAAYNLGCERYGGEDVFPILDEWKKVLAVREAEAKKVAATS